MKNSFFHTYLFLLLTVVGSIPQTSFGQIYLKNSGESHVPNSITSSFQPVSLDPQYEILPSNDKNLWTVTNGHVQFVSPSQTAQVSIDTPGQLVVSCKVKVRSRPNPADPSVFNDYFTTVRYTMDTYKRQPPVTYDYFGIQVDYVSCTKAIIRTRGTIIERLEKWYWQGKNPNGTSTANKIAIKAYDPLLELTAANYPAQSTYEVTEPGTYYIRSHITNSYFTQYMPNPVKEWSKPIAITIDFDKNISNRPVWYADNDQDTFGDPNEYVYSCEQPDGYVSNKLDECPLEGGPVKGCPPSETYTLSLDQGQNYLYTATPLKPIQKASDIKLRKDIIESVTYYDAYGRPRQRIGIAQSPDYSDIVQDIYYDSMGQVKKAYLPFTAGGTGNFKEYDRQNKRPEGSFINAYYKQKYPDELSATKPNAFSEITYFEGTSIPKSQNAPGERWAKGIGSDVEFEYQDNQNEEVPRFDVVYTNSDLRRPTCVHNGWYKAGTLTKEIVKDEKHTDTDADVHTTVRFTNDEGQVVLTRRFVKKENKTVTLDTYYVYDDYGNLSFVLPPNVDISDGVSMTELSDLCYRYIYDDRGRQIEEYQPKKGKTAYFYDDRDRLILTTDPNMNAKGYGLMNFYDRSDRIIATARIIHSLPDFMMRDQVANPVDQIRLQTGSRVDNTDVYYTLRGIPGALRELHTINYYDDYDFASPAGSVPDTPTVFGQKVTRRTKGLPTGTKVRTLGTDKWMTTVVYYDEKARPIYTYEKNEYLNTVNITRIQYDFSGRVLKTEHSHKLENRMPVVTRDEYTYDHAGRAKKHTQVINDQDKELISLMVYDELGQPKEKKVGNTEANPLHTVTYDYNIMGWLTQKQSKSGTTNLLTLDYTYENNGLITMESRTSISDKQKTIYGYDELNRVIWSRDKDKTYSGLNEFKIQYDSMGNIKTLRRGTAKFHSEYGPYVEFFDQLEYAYVGNQLVSVEDKARPELRKNGFKDGNTGSADYVYDSNGNLTQDLNRGINRIAYNYLDLPVSYSDFNNSSITTLKYEANGSRLEVQTIAGQRSPIINTTVYDGGFTYKSRNEGKYILTYIRQSEGYVEPKDAADLSKGFIYTYQVADQVGNIRMSFADLNGNGTITRDEIKEQKNYYPFGLVRENTTGITGRKHEFGFNGTEEGSGVLSGLNLTPFRHYDPTIGRWSGMDPVTHYSMSPYVGMDNNPINLMDPWGADAKCPQCPKPAPPTRGPSELGSSMPGFDPYADPTDYDGGELDEVCVGDCDDNPPGWVNSYVPNSWVTEFQGTLAEWNALSNTYNRNAQEAYAQFYGRRYFCPDSETSTEGSIAVHRQRQR